MMDFRTSSTDWRARALPIAAGAVLLVSLGTLGWSLFGNDLSQPKPVENMPYKCLQCQHEFTVTKDYFRRLAQSGDSEENPALSQYIDCPACKARHSAGMMIRCPACGKFYVPWTVSAAFDAQMGRPPRTDTKDVCPYCKTDRNQWYRDHPAGKP